MKVDVYQKNVALEKLFEIPDTEILLDANLLIPPDRSRFGVRPIAFTQYKEIWLEPLFNEFKNLAIHETVYEGYQKVIANHHDRYIIVDASKPLEEVIEEVWGILRPVIL